MRRGTKDFKGTWPWSVGGSVFFLILENYTGLYCGRKRGNVGGGDIVLNTCCLWEGELSTLGEYNRNIMYINIWYFIYKINEYQLISFSLHKYKWATITEILEECNLIEKHQWRRYGVGEEQEKIYSKELAHAIGGTWLIQDLQCRPAAWRPRRKGLLLVDSKDSMETEFPFPWVIPVFFL